MTLNRRELLASTGSAAGAAVLDPLPLLARGSEDPLPPPPPPETFRTRQVRLRERAHAAGLDALLVTPSTNLAYAANLAIGRSERLTALVLLIDGPSVLITPSFEEANHRRTAVVDEVRTWQEDENPIPVVGKAVAGRKTVGLEGSTAYSTAVALKEQTGNDLRDATAVFDALRMAKSPEEQTLVRDAARRTNAAIDATHARMRAGMTEREVSRILQEEFTRRLVSGGGLVQFGPNAAFPHGAPAERRLAKGDVVLIDAGCRVHGYTSDITRTVVFGNPSDEVRKVYNVVNRAQLTGIEALAVGKPAEEVDRAARRIIEDAGYGAYFTHRLGHGLGMDGHEPPYLVHGNRVGLVEGNVFTVEPGIYLPGKFGVRIEDDYAVGPKGPVSLSVRPGDLMTVRP